MAIQVQSSPPMRSHQYFNQWERSFKTTHGFISTNGWKHMVLISTNGKPHKVNQSCGDT